MTVVSDHVAEWHYLYLVKNYKVDCTSGCDVSHSVVDDVGVRALPSHYCQEELRMSWPAECCGIQEYLYESTGCIGCDFPVIILSVGI